MTEDGQDCDSAAGEVADRSRAQFFRPFAGSPLESRNPYAVRATAAIVWLAFIVFPLANAFGKKGTELEEFLVIAGAAVFVGLYVYLVLHWRGQPRTPIPILVFVAMLAISAALTIFQGSGWGFLFTYCAACAALVPAAGFSGVAACTVLAGVCSALGGANGGTVVGFVASSAGVGLLMLVMRDLRVRNVELNEARAELADLAVAKERERFARDLHDLIGHSLSVIALKAELAGRMLADGPHDAANEVAEVEQVARTALREVREAVSGYRQPTLDGELAGARMALSAAGIEADVEEARVRLDPAVEAVLAWTVREGATNVIRHSGAHHCTFRVTATPQRRGGRGDRRWAGRQRRRRRLGGRCRRGSRRRRRAARWAGTGPRRGATRRRAATAIPAVRAFRARGSRETAPAIRAGHMPPAKPAVPAHGRPWDRGAGRARPHAQRHGRGRSARRRRVPARGDRPGPGPAHVTRVLRA